MRISILYDNTAFRDDLMPDWGFACLVEGYGKTILFDTGAKGSVLLDNMQKMHIEPASVETVFISHDHWDHTGGLSAFLEKNSEVNIFIPPSFAEMNVSRKVTRVDQPMKIYEHFYSTGELDGIEQSMVVETDKGLVIIAGCSHPRMEEILSAASQFGKLYAIVGGLHGFSEYSLFSDLELICATHCTQHKAEIKKRYPDKCIEGGAGKIIEI